MDSMALIPWYLKKTVSNPVGILSVVFHEKPKPHQVIIIINSIVNDIKVNVVAHFIYCV